MFIQVSLSITPLTKNKKNKNKNVNIPCRICSHGFPYLNHFTYIMLLRHVVHVHTSFVI